MIMPPAKDPTLPPLEIPSDGGTPLESLVIHPLAPETEDAIRRIKGAMIPERLPFLSPVAAVPAPAQKTDKGRRRHSMSKTLEVLKGPKN